MKEFGVIALVFVSLVLVSTLVSAQTFAQNVESFLDGLARILEPLARFVVGGGDSLTPLSSEQLFVKFIVFFLVLAMVTLAVSRFPLLQGKKFISFVIAFLIAMLGVRFITSDELINTIWLPYGVLAVSISALLPFIIFFFFLEGFDSTLIRKFGWSSFIVFYLGLAFVRWDDFDIVSSGTGWEAFNLAWIYAAIAGLGLLLLIFDRGIRAMIRRASVRDIQDRKKRVQAARVLGEIDDLYKDLAKTTDPQSRTAIQAEITNKEATLKTFYV